MILKKCLLSSLINYFVVVHVDLWYASHGRGKDGLPLLPSLTFTYFRRQTDENSDSTVFHKQLSIFELFLTR